MAGAYSSAYSSAYDVGAAAGDLLLRLIGEDGMLGRPILQGATDQSTVIRIVDSTDGTPETGVTSATAGLDLEYRREGGAVVNLTESDLAAVDSAHSDGGMIHLGGGYYRIDLPDAAVAAGSVGVLVLGTVTGMVVIGSYHPLWAVNPQDAVRLGLTALPNAAAEAAGGLYTRGTGAGQINQQANGQVDINVARWLNTAAAAPNTAGKPLVDVDLWKGAAPAALSSSGYLQAMLLRWLTDDADGTPAALTLGDYVPAALGVVPVSIAQQATLEAVEADTQDIQSRLPAALVSGRMDSSVGAMAAAVLTATAIAADAITAAKIAADALGASELAADAVAEIVAGVLAAAVTLPTAAPTAPYTVDDILGFLIAVLKFKRTQTTTSETLFQDDGSTTLATAAKSDAGGVFSRGEYT